PPTSGSRCKLVQFGVFSHYGSNRKDSPSECQPAAGGRKADSGPCEASEDQREQNDCGACRKRPGGARERETRFLRAGRSAHQFLGRGGGEPAEGAACPNDIR